MPLTTACVPQGRVGAGELCMWVGGREGYISAYDNSQ